MRKITRPGGVLLLTVPAHPSLWGEFDEVARHRRRYREAELTSALRRAGFAIEFLTPFLSALFPIAWIRRHLSPGGLHAGPPRSELDVTRQELRIVPGVNGLLDRLLGLEAGWIARRQRLPMGTSFLAIARRADPETPPGVRTSYSSS